MAAVHSPGVSDFLGIVGSGVLQIEGLFVGAFCFFWIAWFVIWLLVAIWVYQDAERRGASGVLWLLVVLLLGLLGLIVYLVVRPSGPQPVYGAYPPQGYPPQYQQPGAAIHPQPGASPPPMVPAPAPPSPQPRTPHCPRCGQPLQYVQQYQKWYCPAERVYPWG